MFDSLGDRMKGQYENRTRVFLPRRTFTIIRLDGKAFHTLTRGMEKPFDYEFMGRMDQVGLALCKEVEGTQFAYLQSDEISLLLTDFARPETQAWFDGNLQKITSVSASIATAAFNVGPGKRGLFDARAFTIPDAVEVENYFIWRQNDWTRNSVQMVAQSQFSHKEIHGKSNSEMQDMLFLREGINWNDFPTQSKRGRCVRYVEQGWQVDNEIPIFTQDREYLRGMIPRHWEIAT